MAKKNGDICRDTVNKSSDIAVEAWTKHDVKKWLKSLNLTEFADNFVENDDVNGLALLLMHENDLQRPSLAISRLGDIKRLWYHIRLLQCNNQQFYEHLHLDPTTQQPVPSASTHLLQTNSYNTKSSCQLFIDENSILKTKKGEKTRTIVSFLYALISGIWTSFIMVVVHNRVPNVQKYPPLPDLFLDNIPYIDWAFTLSEFLIVVMSLIFLLILIFHKHWLIILRRFFALGGTIFFLRSITMLVTSLSVPGHHLECTPSQYGTTQEIVTRWLEIFVFQGLSIHGVRSCGDYMFSGHTVMLTLLSHCITEYTSPQFFVLHIASWLSNILGMILILAAHEHYTIDVLIAFFLTSRLFLYYHSLANNAVLRWESDHRTTIWFPLFSFFEKNTQGMVPNKLRIPRLLAWFDAYLSEEEDESSHSTDKKPDKRKQKEK